VIKFTPGGQLHPQVKVHPLEGVIKNWPLLAQNKNGKNCEKPTIGKKQNCFQWLSTFANFVGTIILIMTVVPFFGTVIVPVSVAFYFVQSVYVTTSRQLKRLESVSRCMPPALLWEKYFRSFRLKIQLTVLKK
jgi:Flp pilus assembly protein TadB